MLFRCGGCEMKAVVDGGDCGCWCCCGDESCLVAVVVRFVCFPVKECVYYCVKWSN